jgi:DNA-binding SARP family transcriptional activator/predicted ATPase
MRQGIVWRSVNDVLTFGYAAGTVLELWLLGRAQATFQGSPIQIASRKALALLTYLAVEGGTHHRDAVACLLWPEQGQSQALASLRQALYTLRRSIPKDPIDGDRRTLRIHGDELWIDVWEFDSWLEAAARALPDEASQRDLVRLEHAAALHRGDFMQGFTLRDCPAFDAWQALQAEEQRRKLKSVLRALVDGYVDERELERAIDHGRNLLVLDPYDQAEHRRLMLLRSLADHGAAAIRQHETFVKLLRDDLDVEPDDETTRLAEAIQRREVRQFLKRVPAGDPLAELARLSVEKPQAHESDALHPSTQRRRSNLPPQPTAFVGRRRDLGDLGGLLANPAARWITIVAPGGMGKTRLALAAAERQMAHGGFEDGIYFVPLTSVRAVASFAQAVADAMDIKLLGRDDVAQQLSRHLSGRNLLLVLDDVEHVLNGGGLVSELLADAPDLKVLVTSRVRLDAPEEWLYQLWGLDVPSGTLAVGELRTYGAIELFEGCAKKADPHFDLGANAHDVVRICRHLQGMPLGIELAAAWVTTIPCRDIADEIGKDPGFLETRAHAVADRHRSLKAIIEYSWTQASEAARSTFQGLSVFRGGFTRQAAEQVAGASLPILASLAERALIRLRESGRYDIHELLRQFAEAKLRLEPKAYQVAERAQAMHFADMLAKLEPDLKSARQFEALDDIAADVDNVLTSWHWATSHHDVATIDQLAMGFFLYCEMRGLAQLGNEVLERAIAALGDGDPMDDRRAATLTKLLVGQGILRTRIGLDHPRLRRIAESGLRPLAIHDPLSYVYSVHWLATGLPYRGQHAEAEALLDQAEAVARKADDAFSVATLLQTRGHNLYIAGRLLEAEPMLEKSLTAFDACGDRKFKSVGLNNASRTAMKMGDYDRATSLNPEGLAIRRMANDPLGTAASLIVRGRLKTRLGQYPLARRDLDQAASLMQQSSNYQYWWMLKLDELQLDVERGHHERAHERFQQPRPNDGSLTDPYSEVQRLNGSAHLCYVQRDYVGARSLLERSLAMGDGLGHLHNEATALHHLGFVDLAEGNIGAAKGHFERCLDICRRTGAAPLALSVLLGWAEFEVGARKLHLLNVVLQDARATHHTRETSKRKLFDLAPTDRAYLDVPDLWQVVHDLM